jgi:hypothetical protein
MHSHFIFTGKERDAESGNDYFGARCEFDGEMGEPGLEREG